MLEQTPIQEMTPLLMPLIPKLQKDILEAKQVERKEEEKLAELLNNNETDELLSYKYNVVNAKASRAYAEFKLSYVQSILKGSLQ